jgi:hypothetical protein
MLTFYPSRIPGSKRHRIPDPQHCNFVTFMAPKKVRQKKLFLLLFLFFWIRGPVSEKWKENQGYGVNFPDPQHWYRTRYLSTPTTPPYLLQWDDCGSGPDLVQAANQLAVCWLAGPPSPRCTRGVLYAQYCTP